MAWSHFRKRRLDRLRAILDENSRAEGGGAQSGVDDGATTYGRRHALEASAARVMRLDRTTAAAPAPHASPARSERH
jgi:hypothetical protein